MKDFRSPQVLLVLLFVVVFLVEGAVKLLPPLSPSLTWLFDAILWLVLLTPALYLFEYRPLREALRVRARSEARLRLLIEKNPDGALVVDQEGIVRYLNPAAEALLGRQAEAMLGTPFGFSIAEETTEVEIERSAGETILAEMRVTEIEWEGKPAYLISLRDITARKRMETALERRQTQALDAVQEKGLLLLLTEARSIRPQHPGRILGQGAPSRARTLQRR